MHTSRGPASIIGRLMGPWDNRAGLPEGQEPQHRRARDEFGATVWARRGAAAFVSAAESAGSGAAAAALNAAGGLLIVRGLGGIVDEPSLMSRCVQTTGEGLSSVQDCIRKLLHNQTALEETPPVQLTAFCVPCAATCLRANQACGTLRPAA